RIARASGGPSHHLMLGTPTRRASSPLTTGGAILPSLVIRITPQHDAHIYKMQPRNARGARAAHGAARAPRRSRTLDAPSGAPDKARSFRGAALRWWTQSR